MGSCKTSCCCKESQAFNPLARGFLLVPLYKMAQACPRWASSLWDRRLPRYVHWRKDARTCTNTFRHLGWLQVAKTNASTCHTGDLETWGNLAPLKRFSQHCFTGNVNGKPSSNPSFSQIVFLSIQWWLKVVAHGFYPHYVFPIAISTCHG